MSKITNTSGTALRLPAGVLIDRDDDDDRPAHVVEAGETVELPDEIVGAEAVGEPGEEGHEPATGLLASGQWKAGAGRSGPTVAELKARAVELGIDGASSMRKAELLEAIDEAEKAGDAGDAGAGGNMDDAGPDAGDGNDDEAGDAGEEG